MKAMKRFLSLAMVCLLLCGLLPGFAYADDPAVGAIALSNASGNAGDTITVDVTIQSNPGVMALTLKPQFDTTVLELKETAVDTEAGWTLGADGQVLYDTYPDSTFTGKVVTYTFKILEDAQPGDTQVTLEVKAANYDENLVDFAVTPATITVGGGALEVTFTHSISLGNNLTIYYLVPVSYLEGYENVRLHAEKNKYNGDGSSFTVEEYEITDYTIDRKNGVDRYKFAFSNIAAKEIGDDVVVKVLADKAGVTYSSQEDLYSVKIYAMNQVTKSTTAANLKTLLVDLLNYGAAAQTYFKYRTNSMANADLTAEQQALGTQTLGQLSSCEATETTPGATAHFSSKSVVLDSEIVLKYYMTFDEGQSLDYVRVEFSYVTAVGTPTTVSFDASEFEYEAAKDRYAIRLRTIAVKDAGQPVTAKIYDGSTLISDVFTYSIETYAYKQLEKQDLGAGARAIITAMMIFCKSAESYFTN